MVRTHAQIGLFFCNLHFEFADSNEFPSYNRMDVGFKKGYVAIIIRYFKV